MFGTRYGPYDVSDPCQSPIKSNNPKEKVDSYYFEYFVGNTDILNFSYDPVQQNAILSSLDFVPPKAWFDSRNATIQFKCHLPVQPPWPAIANLGKPGLMDLNLPNSPYFLTLWGFKYSNPYGTNLLSDYATYPIDSNNECVALQPFVQVLDQTGTFNSGNIPLAPTQVPLVSPGRTLFPTVNKDVIAAASNIVNRVWNELGATGPSPSLPSGLPPTVYDALSKIPQVYLVYNTPRNTKTITVPNLTGRDNPNWPDPSVILNTDPRTVQVATFIPPEISAPLISAFNGYKGYTDFLAGNPTSLDYCACSQNLASSPITAPYCPTVCSCLDPIGANIMYVNKNHCGTLGQNCPSCVNQNDPTCQFNPNNLIPGVPGVPGVPPGTIPPPCANQTLLPFLKILGLC